MLIINSIRLQGTSNRTGKPYDVVKVMGISRDYSGNLQTSEFMVSPAEFERAGVGPGDSVRKFSDGGIYVEGLKVLDLSIFDGVV